MPVEASPPTSPGRPPLWAWLAFALATLVAFWPGLDGGFVWDDLTLVARDEGLRSLGNSWQLVSEPLWAGLPEVAADPDLAPGHWRPLTSLTLALGFALGGSAAHTLPFHALSLLLHFAASLAAWRVLRRLVPGTWPAFVGALVFALHPVHVESVSWISAVNDPLFGLFALLSADAWLAWRARGAGLPLAAAGWFLLALLSKELALALPAVFLVLELAWRARGEGGEPAEAPGRGRLLPGLTLLALPVLAWVLLRMAVFGELSAGFLRPTSELGPTGRALMVRLEILGLGFLKLFQAGGGSPLAPFREVTTSADPLQVRAWIGLAAFVVALVVARVRRSPRALAALLLVPAGLLPVLVATGATGQTPYADRYLYLAVLGLSLLVALALAARPRLVVAAPVLLLALAAGTWVRQAPWQDQETLFRHAVAAHPDYPMVHWQLAEVLRQRYLETGDDEAFAEAGVLYDRTLDLLDAARTDPTIPRTEYDYLQANLGKAWWHLLEAEIDEYGEYDTARTIFEMLLERVLQREEANLATGGLRASLPVEQVLTGLGTCQLAAGDRAAAAESFHKATVVQPLYAPPWHNLGVLHFERGRYDQAAHAFDRTLALKPDDTKALAYKAKCLFEQGWPERALEVADRIRELDPGDPEPDLLAGGVASRKRDFRAALVAFDAAVSRAPRSSLAHYHRGVTLWQLGEREEALAALRRACDLAPENFQAHYNLGSMLLEQQSFATARPYLERAYAAADPVLHAAQLPALRQVLFELDPENGPRLRELADLDEARGDLVGALYFTERALVADPDSVRSRHLKGRILLENGEPGAALPELERATELAPGGFGPWRDLGRAQMAVGRYPEARASLTRARGLVAEQPLPAGPEEARAAASAMRQSVLSELDGLLERVP